MKEKGHRHKGTKGQRGKGTKVAMVVMDTNIEKELVLPSFAKINLALSVGKRESDGFHNITTIFQTISLCDTISFKGGDDIILTCNDATLPVDSSNLILKAIHAVNNATKCTKGVSIRLHKKIPMKAGLGGGSSNAAITLLALNNLWGLNLRYEEISEIASSIGSDVPFFLLGGCAIGIGRGNEISRLPDIHPMFLCILKPDFDVATKEAYLAIDKYREGELTLKNKGHKIELLLSSLRAKSLRELCWNDFDEVAMNLHPEIRDDREALIKAGAKKVLLCGSGSALAGFYDSPGLAKSAANHLISTGRNCFFSRTISFRFYRNYLKTKLKEAVNQ